MPQTATATDALAERKKILEGNAKLIQERDLIETDLKMLRSVSDALHQSINAMHGTTLTTREIADKFSADLIARKDELRRDINDSETRLETAKSELSRHTTLVDDKKKEVAGHEAHLNIVRQEVANTTAVANAAKTEHEKNKVTQGEELSSLRSMILSASASLEAIRKEEADLKAFRVAEDIRLANKDHDLAVWEGRIRKAAAELDPPIEIII